MYASQLQLGQLKAYFVSVALTSAIDCRAMLPDGACLGLSKPARCSSGSELELDAWLELVGNGLRILKSIWGIHIHPLSPATALGI